MTTITLTLPDSLKPFIDAQVSAGGFPSASAYLEALLTEAQKQQERSEIEAKLLVGIEQLDRGEGRELQPAE